MVINVEKEGTAVPIAEKGKMRSLAQTRCEIANVRLRIPAPGLCTDNGAMVASLGSAMVSAGREPSPIEVAATSNLMVTCVSLL